MDAGDIIYYIVLALLGIFSFFNKARKDKKRGGKPETPKKSIFEEIFSQETPPPLPKMLQRKKESRKNLEKNINTQQNTRPEFQSSLSLVTDFEKESSIGGPLFVNEGTHSIFSQTKEEETYFATHPLLEDLTTDSASEMRKAVIYSEIFQRKF